MIPLMVYIYAPGYQNMDGYCSRFVKTYIQYPPDYDHVLCVIVNGARLSNAIRSKFKGIECVYEEYDNVGMDIGAYVYASKLSRYTSSAIFCCGSNLYFKRQGWLKRFMDVWNDYGPSLYGSLATNEVRPHIRTTGFLVPKFMLFSYPHNPITNIKRHTFEYGNESLIWWCSILKHVPYMVTWSGVYTCGQWGRVKKAYRSGDQSECLCHDLLCDKHSK